MQPLPKQGNRGVCGKAPIGFPFSGHNPAEVSKLPFLSITIQNCHGLGESLTSHFDPRNSSFSTAYRSGSSTASGPIPGNGVPTPSLFSSSVTLWATMPSSATKTRNGRKKCQIETQYPPRQETFIFRGSSLVMSKQSAALGLPIFGASFPTSLQKFHASKATPSPSLRIPGSPTADT